MAINVKIKMPGLDAMRKKLANNPRLSAAIAKAWSTIYRSFVRMRFVAQSRGAGEWPPLKPSTIKRRRKGRGRSKASGSGGAAIFRDTGAMFAALQPTLTNGSSILKTTPRPIGFTASLDGTPLGKIASYHHLGEGHLPKREILAVPDQATIDTMAKHGKRIIAKELNDR